MGTGLAPGGAAAASAAALTAALAVGCSAGGGTPAGAGTPDHQSMGLSGGQNEILRAVVAAGRELAAREAQSRRAERSRSAAPTGGPC